MIIFLPVRNGVPYLAEAIGSVLAQTSADWRLVVLENGSTDDTVAVVERFRDSRIELLPAPAPLGIVENWRRTGDYLTAHGEADALVTIIGHDDRFMPHFVERVTAMAATEPDATLYQTGFDLIDSAGALIRPCRPIPSRESWTDLAAALCWGLRDSFGTGYAFRARDFLAVGGMPPLPRLMSSDHLLFVALTRLGYKAADPATGCAYRLHGGSTSGGVSRDQLNAHLEGLHGLVDALRSMGFDTSQPGRDALAALLARELELFDMAPVRRILTPANAAHRATLTRLFDDVARGLPAAMWSAPTAGRFARTTRPLRRLGRAMSIGRRLRRG